MIKAFVFLAVLAPFLAGCSTLTHQSAPGVDLAKIKRVFVERRLADNNNVRDRFVRALQAKGRRVRLVSMPSTDTFDAQPESYREQVLPAGVTRRVAIEAGATQSWWRYVGLQGKVLGIDQFGASGKAPELYRHFGLTADNVTGSVERLLGE